MSKQITEKITQASKALMQQCKEARQGIEDCKTHIQEAKAKRDKLKAAIDDKMKSGFKNKKDFQDIQAEYRLTLLEITRGQQALALFERNRDNAIYHLGFDPEQVEGQHGPQG